MNPFTVESYTEVGTEKKGLRLKQGEVIVADLRCDETMALQIALALNTHLDAFDEFGDETTLEQAAVSDVLHHLSTIEPADEPKTE